MASKLLKDIKKSSDIIQISFKNKKTDELILSVKAEYSIFRGTGWEELTIYEEGKTYEDGYYMHIHADNDLCFDKKLNILEVDLNNVGHMRETLHEYEDNQNVPKYMKDLTKNYKHYYLYISENKVNSENQKDNLIKDVRNFIGGSLGPIYMWLPHVKLPNEEKYEYNETLGCRMTCNFRVLNITIHNNDSIVLCRHKDSLFFMYNFISGELVLFDGVYSRIDEQIKNYGAQRFIENLKLILEGYNLNCMEE